MTTETNETAEAVSRQGELEATLQRYVAARDAKAIYERELADMGIDLKAWLEQHPGEVLVDSEHGITAELHKLHAAGARPKTEQWLKQIADWRDEFPLRYAKGGDVMKPQAVLETLQALTADRDDVIFTTGVGQHQMWAMQYLLCNRPRTFITSGGLGTMGYGIPAAIGAKAARPDATVVCVDGDGCFQMTCQELATATLEQLPIVVVLVNNGYLGMVQQWQSLFFEDRLSHVHLTHQVPDYQALAEAYGAAGFTVTSEDDLEGALTEALTCGRTAVVDCRVDPREAVYPMIPAGAAAVDMIEFQPEAGAIA